MANLKLTILSPESRFLEGVTVDEVTLHGSEGEIQILPGHAAIVGTLENGAFHYLTGGKRMSGMISSGFFEVRDDQLTVLAETIEGTGGKAEAKHAE